MYAIIETGGKQIKVEAGQAIYIEKLNAEAGETVTFDKVFSLVEKMLKLEAQLLKVLLLQLKLKNKVVQKKIIVFKYKARKTTIKSKVIVNHTLKLLLKQSTRKVLINR